MNGNGLRLLARHKTLRQHIKLDAAGVTVAGLWAAALTVDYFIARGNLKRPVDGQLRMITEWGQDNPVIAIGSLVYLIGHIANLWGRFDPIGVIGRHLKLQASTPADIVETHGIPTGTFGGDSPGG